MAITYDGRRVHACDRTIQALERDASGAAQTLITLTHEKLAESVIEAHRGGWTSILVGLATFHGDE
jgi:hypothetical protein